jgi:hypothetical protein
MRTTSQAMVLSGFFSSRKITLGDKEAVSPQESGRIFTDEGGKTA